jgi:DNA-binding transcriptional regulator YdaS (Cro superfamily)
MAKFDGGKVTKWKQGEYEFAIRNFDPFLAMEVLGDLQKVLVPALGGAATGVNSSGEGVEVVAAIGGALKNISQSVSGKVLRESAELLLDSEYLAVKEGRSFVPADKDKLAAIYWGRPFDMVALCIKVFEVNFLDFSTSCSVPTGVREAVSAIQQMVQEQPENTSDESSSSTE